MKKYDTKHCGTGVQIFDIENKRFVKTTLKLLRDNFKPEKLNFSIFPLRKEVMLRTDFSKVQKIIDQEKSNG